MQNTNTVPVKCDFCGSRAIYTEHADGSAHGLPSKNIFYCEKHRKALKKKAVR